jgi:hypothetical protein
MILVVVARARRIMTATVVTPLEYSDLAIYGARRSPLAGTLSLLNPGFWPM